MGFPALPKTEKTLSKIQSAMKHFKQLNRVSDPKSAQYNSNLVESSKKYAVLIIEV